LRIAFSSDFHVDISQRNWELVPYMNEVLKIIEPDVFVIAGDVSPELGDIEYTLDAFRSLDCLKLFVPGNQDVWVLSEEMQRKGHDSYEKYYFYLPEVCRRNRFVPLWMEPVVHEHVGFVGSIGWYDLGFRHYHPSARPLSLDREVMDNLWNDARWACWSDISAIAEDVPIPVRRPDAEVAREFNLKLDQDIDLLEKDGTVREIVAVTHFPPFQRLVEGGKEEGGEGDEEGYGKEESFPVCGETGKLLLSHSKVSLSISGHLHDRRDVLVEKVRAVRCPVGYLTRDHRKYQEIVRDCLEVIHFIGKEELMPPGEG
jgi:hypothetical protein